MEIFRLKLKKKLCFQKFLFKILGGVLAKIRNLQFVVDHLDLMFRNVNHAHPLERLVSRKFIRFSFICDHFSLKILSFFAQQGCAQGVGYCSSSHIDIVLTKLENVAKLEYQRKSTGFLGFIKVNLTDRFKNFLFEKRG